MHARVYVPYICMKIGARLPARACTQVCAEAVGRRRGAGGCVLAEEVEEEEEAAARHTALSYTPPSAT